MVYQALVALVVIVDTVEFQVTLDIPDIVVYLVTVVTLVYRDFLFTVE